MGWTDEEVRELEGALDAIGEMISIYSEKIYEESKKPDPDLDYLQKLREGNARVAKERRDLHLGDREAIRQIRDRYGAYIRALNTGAEFVP